MAKAKYFHISDLISFYSGRVVVSQDEMTAPDGEKRPAWDGGLSPMLAVAEQLDGRSFWIDKASGYYDGDRLGVMLPSLRNALETQLPWLKDYPREAIPKAPEGASASEVRQFYRDFVAAAAAAHGGEWFGIRPATPSPPSKPGFRTMTFG